MVQIGKKITKSVDFSMNACKREIVIENTKHVKQINEESPEEDTSKKYVVNKVNHSQRINFNKKRENAELVSKL